MKDEILIFFFTKVTSEISFVILILIILHILIIQKRQKDASFLFISSIATVGSIWILKNLLKVERPEGALFPLDGYAFPSGHAALSAYLGFVFYDFFVKNMQKKYHSAVVAGIFIFILSVGLSRIYFGVHTLIQISAGYLIGFCIPFFLNKIRK